MGFGQGLSGLNAAAQNLDVIGNNIANSGTVGFKASTATFADVYANSRVGIGTSVASINQRFTIGTVSSTGNQFDMAIDGAKGLFRVTDPSGNVLYTRNGQFFADKDNNIVNAQGQRLTGYAAGGTNMEPVQVPVGNIPPLASSTMTTKANFDANAQVIGLTPAVDGKITLTAAGGGAVTGNYTFTRAGGVPGGAIVWNQTPPPGTYTVSSGPSPVVVDGVGVTAPPLDATSFAGANTNYIPEVYTPIGFDPANPDSYNASHSLRTNVYDSLGNSHELTQYFAKRPEDPAFPNQSIWEVNYRLDGQLLDAPVGSKQTLRFDAAGRLDTSLGAVTLDFNAPGAGASPAAPLSISLNYNGTTQFGGPFSSNFTQNGYPTGEYASMSIANNGGPRLWLSSAGRQFTPA